MGSKADLHPAVAPGAPVTVASGLGIHRLPQALALFLIACLCLLLSLLTVLQPVRCRVAGSSHVLWHGATVAAASTAAGARPGDLLDVRGAVLRGGQGLPPLVLRDGQALAPDARVQQQDELSVTPGADLTEPLRERTRLLPEPRLRGYLPPAVAGTQRLQVGLLSGQAALETVSAVPTVPVTAAPPPRKLVALTFDDGPWSGQTARILDILEKHNARATFFVLGALARGHPDLIRREISQNCEVGVHTWYHANLARTSAGTIIADLNRCQQTLQGIIGQRVPLMRPPYGALNARARAAIAQTGLRIIMWSADTNDWQRPGADTIYARIMNGARNGAIILCHDGGGPRSGTIAAVSRAVPALQKRGYELVTVSELLSHKSQPEGGALILAEGRRLEVKRATPAVKLEIDGEPVPLAEDPVEIEGQLLLPVRPVLELLGLRWSWDQTAQKLTLAGPFERLVLRLNSLKMETGPGVVEEIPAPPILYRNILMVPLWVPMRAAQASGLYNPATKTLRLISLERTMRGEAEGLLAPQQWGKGVGWREYLGGP